MSAPAPLPEMPEDALPASLPPALAMAPCLSPGQRLRRMAFVGLPLALLLAAVEFAGLPWLKAYLTAHPCQYWHGWELDRIAAYGLFGLPLVVVLGIAAWWLLLGGLRILRDGQAPPAGARVWLPTPVLRGKAARRVGRLHIAAFAIVATVIMAALWLGTRTFDTLQAENPNRCGERLQRSI